MWSFSIVVYRPERHLPYRRNVARVFTSHLCDIHNLSESAVPPRHRPAFQRSTLAKVRDTPVNVPGIK